MLTKISEEIWEFPLCHLFDEAVFILATTVVFTYPNVWRHSPRKELNDRANSQKAFLLLDENVSQVTEETILAKLRRALRLGSSRVPISVLYVN
jgi:hypothetical protein